ncbi:MAG: ATP-binding protein, partial [Nitrospinae bacterium]|nr:ATP-binding protein [Nitrospinota bacterium]
MDKKNSIVEFLNSEDPLSDSALDFVIKYKEEDDYIEYKLTLDPSSEKEWLELTKDISAFANTYGGYLVFGVKNDTKEPVGLDDTPCKILADVNNIQQKINRFLEPEINTIRSKQHKIGEQVILIVYIPQSTSATHIISKDGEFIHISGKSKILLRKGTFYIRRSGGNHLGDARDLDQLIDRRINHYRETLLSRIARVVEASTESEIFVLAKDPEDKESKRFIIQDGPDSIPIKGMSFSVAPTGLEEQIAAWTVISSGNPRVIPPTENLWHWYKKREELQIPKHHLLALAQFSMWANAPIFFWLRGLVAQDIEETIWHSLQHRPAKWQLRSF